MPIDERRRNAIAQARSGSVALLLQLPAPPAIPEAGEWHCGIRANSLMCLWLDGRSLCDNALIKPVLRTSSLKSTAFGGLVFDRAPVIAGGVRAHAPCHD
jgi:hypothetical protein